MATATIIKLAERMGLDSHQPSAAGDGLGVQQVPLNAPDRPARASTASMQSLLAHYFASNDSHSALSATVMPDAETSESRTSGLNIEPSALNVPSIQPVSSPSSLVAQPDWPAEARALIDSLMRENAQWREQFQLQSLRLQSAQDQADSDVLTPTLNRRAFLHEVHRAMADCRRYGEEACLIYLDMDGFKSINDIYGHAAGDAALIHTAQVLNDSVREGDSVGRMGGDEFAILLRHADLKSSRIKAMKLEAELMTGTFEHNGLYLKVGGSFGVRCYASQDSAEAWVSEADAAMFLSKKSSR